MNLYLIWCILTEIVKCINNYKTRSTDYGVVKIVDNKKIKTREKKTNDIKNGYFDKLISTEVESNYSNFEPMDNQDQQNDDNLNGKDKYLNGTNVTNKKIGNSETMSNNNKKMNSNELSKLNGLTTDQSNATLLKSLLGFNSSNSNKNPLSSSLLGFNLSDSGRNPLSSSLLGFDPYGTSGIVNNPLVNIASNVIGNNPINNPQNVPNIFPGYHNIANPSMQIPYYNSENNTVKNLPAPTINNPLLDNSQNNILNNPANTVLDNTLIRKPADRILSTTPENLIDRINDSRKELKYKNVSGENRDLTGKEMDLKNNVSVEIREKEMQLRKNLGQRAGVYCDAKYPFHCRPILSPEARDLKDTLENTRRPRYIPETINVQNDDLVKTMELNLSTIPEFYREKPDSYNNLLKMISSKGIDDPKKLEGQKISGFPDPGYVIKSLEEGLTFHASVKKYLRTLLEKTRELINKAEEKMKDLAGILKRKRRDAEDLYVNMTQSKSISFQAEMKKQLLQLLEETMANDAEFHDTKDWIYKMRQGLSYNTS